MCTWSIVSYSKEDFEYWLQANGHDVDLLTEEEMGIAANDISKAIGRMDILEEMMDVVMEQTIAFIKKKAEPQIPLVGKGCFRAYGIGGNDGVMRYSRSFGHLLAHTIHSVYNNDKIWVLDVAYSKKPLLEWKVSMTVTMTTINSYGIEKIAHYPTESVVQEYAKMCSNLAHAVLGHITHDLPEDTISKVHMRQFRQRAALVSSWSENFGAAEYGEYNIVTFPKYTFSIREYDLLPIVKREALRILCGDAIWKATSMETNINPWLLNHLHGAMEAYQELLTKSHSHSYALSSIEKLWMQLGCNIKELTPTLEE